MNPVPTVTMIFHRAASRPLSSFKAYGMRRTPAVDPRNSRTASAGPMDPSMSRTFSDKPISIVP